MNIGSEVVTIKKGAAKVDIEKAIAKLNEREYLKRRIDGIAYQKEIRRNP